MDRSNSGPYNPGNYLAVQSNNWNRPSANTARPTSEDTFPLDLSFNIEQQRYSNWHANCLLCFHWFKVPECWLTNGYYAVLQRSEQVKNLCHYMRVDISILPEICGYEICPLCESCEGDIQLISIHLQQHLIPPMVNRIQANVAGMLAVGQAYQPAFLRSTLYPCNIMWFNKLRDLMAQAYYKKLRLQANAMSINTVGLTPPQHASTFAFVPNYQAGIGNVPTSDLGFGNLNLAMFGSGFQSHHPFNFASTVASGSSQSGALLNTSLYQRRMHATYFSHSNQPISSFGHPSTALSTPMSIRNSLGGNGNPQTLNGSQPREDGTNMRSLGNNLVTYNAGNSNAMAYDPNNRATAYLRGPLNQAESVNRRRVFTSGGGCFTIDSVRIQPVGRELMQAANNLNRGTAAVDHGVKLIHPCPLFRNGIQIFKCKYRAGIETFECSICNWAVVIPAGQSNYARIGIGSPLKRMQLHIQAQHKDHPKFLDKETPVRMYSCPDCKQTFHYSNKWQYNKHQRICYLISTLGLHATRQGHIRNADNQQTYRPSTSAETGDAPNVLYENVEIDDSCRLTVPRRGYTYNGVFVHHIIRGENEVDILKCGCCSHRLLIPKNLRRNVMQNRVNKMDLHIRRTHPNARE